MRAAGPHRPGIGRVPVHREHASTWSLGWHHMTAGGERRAGRGPPLPRQRGGVHEDKTAARSAAGPGSAVGKDAHVRDGAAERLEERLHGMAVGIEDGAGPESPARFDNLVSGGKERHRQTLAAWQRGQSDRCGKADVERFQPASPGKDHAAAADVLARLAPVGAAPCRRVRDDRVALDADVFLHRDRIAALGHGRAGEDPDGFSAADGAPEALPGGDPRGHGEGGAVAVEERVAVDRGVGMGRNVHGRHDIPRKDASRGPVEDDLFGPGDGTSRAGDEIEGFSGRHQAAFRGVPRGGHEPSDSDWRPAVKARQPACQ